LNAVYGKRPKLTGEHPRCPVCEMGGEAWASEDLKKLWPAILETFGVAEVACPAVVRNSVVAAIRNAVATRFRAPSCVCRISRPPLISRFGLNVVHDAK